MDGSAALTDTKSPNHHNGHQHGSGARHDDHGTTTLYTAGDQPKNWRATISMTGGQRPESRHDRYASRNAGDVHDGTGPGELRCDSETAARVSSLEQTIPSFRLYETGVPSATSRTMLEDAWIALAGFEGRQYNDTAHAEGSSSTHSHSGRTFPRHDHQLRFASDDREDVREARQDEDHHQSTCPKTTRQSDEAKPISKQE